MVRVAGVAYFCSFVVSQGLPHSAKQGFLKLPLAVFALTGSTPSYHTSKIARARTRAILLVRVAGVEPASPAWKASIIAAIQHSLNTYNSCDYSIYIDINYFLYYNIFIRYKWLWRVPKLWSEI